jgi:hypothetical protein
MGLEMTDPILQRVAGLLNVTTKVTTKEDLLSRSSLIPNEEDQSSDDGVYNSMDKIMSSGFNRIVIVESDQLDLTILSDDFYSSVEQLNRKEKI